MIETKRANRRIAVERFGLHLIIIVVIYFLEIKVPEENRTILYDERTTSPTPQTASDPHYTRRTTA